MSTLRVLLVDDDLGCLEGLGDYLELEGFTTIRYSSSAELVEQLDSISADIAIVDLKMPHIGGLELLPILRERLDIPTVMLTAFGDVQTAVEAVRQGAHDFRLKPIAPEALVTLIKNAVAQKRLQQENMELRRQLSERYSLGQIVGKSAQMQRVFTLIKSIAPTDSAVLLRGATGTGKELVARAIHFNSHRAKGPFIAVNCAALSPELFQSEVFGHVRGAFTGAVSQHCGYLEQANGGTLFLDEVGAMPINIQAKFLRALETKQFQQVGSTENKTTDARIISATNSDLEQHIREGRFRRDLFFRLNVVPVKLPPLSERREDIPLLAKHFLKEWCEKYGRKIVSLSPEAIQKLSSHSWPGNVRELRNVIEHAVLASNNSSLAAEELTLSDKVSHSDILTLTDLPPFEKAREDHIKKFEENYFRVLLSKTEGNVKEASKLSGINYRTLRRRLKSLGINRKEYQS